MRTWLIRAGIVVVCVAAMVIGSRSAASGQQAPTREDVLQSLLVEVRGLRTAMEQMASAGPRVQVAIGRLQLQEQRVNTTRRRLDGVRDSIQNAEREGSEARDRLASLEDVAQRSADAAEREAAAAQAKATKAALARNAADVQRLRGEEAELVGAVSTEEGRWMDISQRLDELERVLASRR